MEQYVSKRSLSPPTNLLKRNAQPNGRVRNRRTVEYKPSRNASCGWYQVRSNNLNAPKRVRLAQPVKQRQHRHQHHPDGVAKRRRFVHDCPHRGLRAGHHDLGRPSVRFSLGGGGGAGGSGSGPRRAARRYRRTLSQGRRSSSVGVAGTTITRFACPVARRRQRWLCRGLHRRRRYRWRCR